ncbi:type VI secretion system Vgr family protein [Massilia orientalis]|uniref:Type VI secretion system Vgr family protein n=1 Tax=Massilia orientalis TaxID=3050128 RepID=A0ACC7MKT4_9BURK|nr:type VI secretion system Vgr family protein [Massilia sp. YIM B02787]
MTTQIQHLRDRLAGRQHNRILRLSFPNDDGPSCEFVVNALHARESMSRDFEYVIEILSDSPSIALEDIQGKLISVELVQRGGTLRYFTDYVFEFRLKRVENIAFYEAKLGPWMKYLSYRKDCYIFHNATLYDQTSSVFEDYASHAVWRTRLYADDPPMTDAFQFEETDFNYLSRRWEAAGMHYFYEHDAKGHTLVLGDDTTRADPIDGAPSICLHLHRGGARDGDTIDEWSPVRAMASSGVQIGSFDFKRPQPATTGLPSIDQQGGVLRVETYEYAGAYGFKDARDGERLARIRIEEIEAMGKRFEAAGSNRYIQPGRWFTLTDRYGNDLFGDDSTASQFLILDVQHVVTNNYLQQGDTPPKYENRFVCVPKQVPWRPGRGFNSTDTRIVGPQTATVVGPNGQGSIYTDEHGRIRVQFHWDRVGDNNDASSAWIRMSNPWAGAQLGAAAIHRVGSEVVVSWLDGSPDRPIVLGGVHNQNYAPPWALPGQRALMGFRTRELGPEGGNTVTGRSNHLILDDTHQRIQAQLKSDHEHSQLSLGHISRIEDNAGRMDVRGEGFELATGAWGVLRAGKGMLISTEARPRASSHIKDMVEGSARLGSARDLHDDLVDAAQHAGAQNAQQHQSDAAAAIRAQNDVIKGGKGGEFPELSEPMLVLSSPAGISATSARSTHLASDEHVAVTAGKDVSVASGRSLFASVRETLRLFVQKAGMKLIAASGDIDVKALSDSINLLAKLNITHSANRITINAKEEVVINGGGSYVKFSAAGIEHGTNGDHVVHAANHDLSGPRGMDALRQEVFEQSKPQRYSQQLAVDRNLWDLPSGVRMLKYQFISDTAGVLGSGVLDGSGKSKPLFTESSEQTKVVVDVNDGKWTQLVTDRPDAISLPEDGEMVVFDFEEHDEVEDDDGPDDAPDPTLAITLD